MKYQYCILSSYKKSPPGVWYLATVFTNLVIFFICKFQIIKTANKRKKIVTFEIHSSDLLSLAEHKINRSSNFKNFCSTPRQRNLTDLKILIFKFINTWLLISTLVFLNAFVSKRLLCDHKYRSKCYFHTQLPALVIIFHIKIVKRDDHCCSLWDRNQINAVLIRWVVRWVSRAHKCAVYHLATAYRHTTTSSN